MKRLYPILAIILSLCTAVDKPISAQTLPPWQEGYFDIHHINTGSGNCTFMIFPDGTTLLVDAGDVNRSVRAMGPTQLKIAPRLPHDSLSAAQSMMLYIRKTLPAITAIDYGLITHFHGDHYGVITAQSKPSQKGNYRLSGITEIHEYLPIIKLIDRNYPSYNYPVEIRRHHFDSTTFINYLGFVQARKTTATMVTESLRVGSRNQIIPKKSRHDDFMVRNLKSNGDIWSGTKEGTISILPDHIHVKDYNENPLSIALKISYGKFDYFTGGDMTGITGNGVPDLFDVETAVGKIVQHVEAMTLNHHGVRDATNEDFLRSLSPQVIIQQSWSSNHPGEEVLHRIISKDIYPAPRDIFATYVHAETLATYGPWFNAYKSMRGHVVVRVLPAGNQFYVYVLNDSDVNLPIVKSFGPYQSE
jgi:beta-lactamase superfamily II metal-dependent hydrolase